MATKMTKKDYFNILRATPAVQADPALVAFIDHELELLEKHNSTSGGRKPTARQVENDGIRESILEYMIPGEKYTITQLLKSVPGLPEDMTNQRMTAIVRQMIGEEIERLPEGNKTYFRLK